MQRLITKKTINDETYFQPKLDQNRERKRTNETISQIKIKEKY